MKKITEHETDQLIELLAKLHWPVSKKIFNALCENLIMCAFELAVLRRTKAGTEVLMFERNDEYFQGWHIPGTILRPGDTEQTAFSRLIKKEVHVLVSNPIFVERVNILKGKGEGQYARGQVYASLFLCFLKQKYTGQGTFFPLNKIPKTTLSGHKILLKLVKNKLAKS